MKLIAIYKSPNADSRTAETSDINVLKDNTVSHIEDVTKALQFISNLISARGPLHDHTKIENLEDFHKALNSGHIKDTEWYKMHITTERHHLKSHCPNDVTIIDVIEHICDCTMAGLARSGTVYDTDLDPEILQLAVKNTVDLLIKNTTVIDSHLDNTDILSEEI